MNDTIAMIRDATGSGVRVDRIDGWESRGTVDETRVHLTGGGVVDLHILPDDFVRRLDKALTALVEARR